IALHSVVISANWPGHCYGPRYFSDMTGLFVLFLIPAVNWWLETPTGALRTGAAVGFLAFALGGVAVHARGATSVAAYQWNVVPLNVDDAPWRVWDWSDPQFLRGLR